VTEKIAKELPAQLGAMFAGIDDQKIDVLLSILDRLEENVRTAIEPNPVKPG